jgi:PTH2 family peptidyl-tRNA hydrolase
MIKQVLVVRTDLKMRRGKESAQCCHGSLAFIGRQIQQYLGNIDRHVVVSFPSGLPDHAICVPVYVSRDEAKWFLDIYTKITLAAENEAELMEIKRLAEEAGLQVHLVIDAGLTEIPPNTPTCLAIGPDESEKIDAITGPNGVHPLKLR